MNEKISENEILDESTKILPKIGREETPSPASQKRIKERKKKNKKRQTLLIILVVLIVLIAAGITWYMISNSDNRSFDNAEPALCTVENEQIKVTFTENRLLTKLEGFTFDPDYVYVALVYEIQNKTSEPLTKDSYPYVTVSSYEKKGAKFKAVHDSQEEFDLNALQLFGIQKELDFSDIQKPLEPQQTRIGADVIKIPKTRFNTEVQYISIDVIDAIITIGESEDVPSINE